MFTTILFIIAAAFYTYRTRCFLQVAQQVHGELVDYQSFRDDEGDWLHHPVFRFVDTTGNVVTVWNPRNVWVVHKPPVGQQYELLYNPANPSQVLRTVWYEIWFGPAVLWAVGLLGLVQAVFG